jgi:hypothetical protein
MTPLAIFFNPFNNTFEKAIEKLDIPLAKSGVIFEGTAFYGKRQENRLYEIVSIEKGIEGKKPKTANTEKYDGVSFPVSRDTNNFVISILNQGTYVELTVIFDHDSILNNQNWLIKLTSNLLHSFALEIGIFDFDYEDESPGLVSIEGVLNILSSNDYIVQRRPLLMVIKSELVDEKIEKIIEPIKVKHIITTSGYDVFSWLE